METADMSSHRITTSLEAEQILLQEAALRKANKRFPEESVLAEVLTGMLQGKGLTQGAPQIISRDRTGRSSTFANEIVTCRLDDGSELRLLCKYARNNSHPAFGHRRGIEYEVRTYETVLESLGMSTPRFYGSHYHEPDNEHWVVMEYLEGGLTVNKGPQPAAIISAAQWIGTFHARGAEWLERESPDWLIEYDQDYFAGWAERLLDFAQPLHSRYPWLNELCSNYAVFVPRLLAIPRTLIHGEFTVHNVILRHWNVPKADWVRVSKAMGGVDIAPIDWESTAVSFGEIDIAFLLDGTWPEDVQRVCFDQYRKFRWGDNAPPDFEDNLKAAKLYLNLRWLGDRPEKTLLEKSSWRLDRVQAMGQQLGLI
jgi:hypothetical protein